MKKRDLIIFVVILLVAVIALVITRPALFGIAGTVPLTPAATQMGAEFAASPSPEGDEAVIRTPFPLPTLAPAEAYLVVHVGNEQSFPYPLNGDEALDIPVTQPNGLENTIHTFKNGFRMASANCDNQNCVHQEEVTLENHNRRILFNFIYCLPNQVVLELLTSDAANLWMQELAAHYGY